MSAKIIKLIYTIIYNYFMYMIKKYMLLANKLFRHVEVRDIYPILVRFLVPRNDVLL